MSHYIVVARREFDDEDSLFVFPLDVAPEDVFAAVQLRAQEAFNAPIAEVFVNYIVKCDSAPTVLLRNV